MNKIFGMIILQALCTVAIVVMIAYGVVWVFENVDIAYELGDAVRRFDEAREGKQ